MRAIVGLGNPGHEYENTRHNLGFLVADAISEKIRARFLSGRGDYLIAKGNIGGTAIALVKPLTYMNNSGVAVRDVIERYDVKLDDLLIVIDDFQLPFGAIRLRPRGSSGGHNGLYSIIYQLQSEEFPRLRCGIGNASIADRSVDTTDFVLSAFEKEERDSLRNLVTTAASAAITAATEGIEIAMSRFNSGRKV